MASNINSVVISGRLTRDAEFHAFSESNGCINFSVANNRTVKKDGQWTDIAQYFDIKYFSKGAERLCPYMTKGSKVIISGQLVQEKWQSKEGETKTAIRIYADNVELAGGNKPQGHQTPAAPTMSQEPQYDFGGEPSFSEDVPF